MFRKFIQGRKMRTHLGRGGGGGGGGGGEGGGIRELKNVLFEL